MNLNENTETEIAPSNIEVNVETQAESEIDPEVASLKEGEQITLVRVRFPGNSRSFPFLYGKRQLLYGQKVVAMSDRGVDIGYINSIPYQVYFHKGLLPLRSIIKVATLEDFTKQKMHNTLMQKAQAVCVDQIEKLRLEMVLTHVEVIEFGKKIVIYFNAPERVDFRELVRRLVQDLKVRVELRQISLRDRAAAIGAVGACGLQTCCSSFLKNYGNASIRMAKNQNLALIPTKINGVCGQIKCCIKYEDDVYTEKRKILPLEGSFIQTANGDRGKILNLQVLNERFEMLTERGERRVYFRTQYNPDTALPEGWNFPAQFEHILNETKVIIGMPVVKVENTNDPQASAAEFDDLLENDHEMSDEDQDDLDDVNKMTAELENIGRNTRYRENSNSESRDSSSEFKRQNSNAPRPQSKSGAGNKGPHNNSNNKRRY
jgi:cell fate regulator YaaT (PSP1 superfamily)